METEQYDIMARAEEQHWWYLGLRDAMGRCLTKPISNLPSRPNILDAGCGTGGNLRFLTELLQPAYAAGFDVSELALKHARRKCPQADLYLCDIRNPELHVPNFDLIISCDVIYVPGLEDSLAGLQRMVASLKPGGLFVVNLPAYQWLTSAHDRAVHTRQRFQLTQIQELLFDLQLESVRISYRLCTLFPLIVLKRLPSLLRFTSVSNASELRQPPGWLNRVLRTIVTCENRLIARDARLPFGSSIFAIGRKPSASRH